LDEVWNLSLLAAWMGTWDESIIVVDVGAQFCYLESNICRRGSKTADIFFGLLELGFGWRPGFEDKRSQYASDTASNNPSVFLIR
jgi:hypothetical protein